MLSVHKVSCFLTKVSVLLLLEAPGCRTSLMNYKPPDWVVDMLPAKVDCYLRKGGWPVLISNPGYRSWMARLCHFLKYLKQLKYKIALCLSDAFK